MTTESFSVARGETRTWTLTVVDVDGATIDLTGLKIYATVYGIDGTVLFAKASIAAGGSDDQIEIPDQVAGSGVDEGKLYLKVDSTDTDLEMAARWCDVWIQTSNEKLKVRERTPFYVTSDQAQAFV